MKIIALLSWFDEDPTRLAELVTSLRRAGVDHVVAVDGRYDLYPSSQTESSEEEHKALWECTGVDLTVHTPAEPFAGEIEKRNLLFRMGHALAEPYEDWLWVIDGDEVVTSAVGLREALERTEMDVLSVTEYGDGNTRNERRLFRAHPKGIHLEGKHSRYVNGDGDVLWGVGEVFSERLNVQVLHRPHERSKERNDARNAYYEAVKEHKAELLI